MIWKKCLKSCGKNLRSCHNQYLLMLNWKKKNRRNGNGQGNQPFSPEAELRVCQTLNVQENDIQDDHNAGDENDMEKVIQSTGDAFQMIHRIYRNHVEYQVDDGRHNHRGKKPVLYGILPLCKKVNGSQIQHNPKASGLASDRQEISV